MWDVTLLRSSAECVSLSPRLTPSAKASVPLAVPWNSAAVTPSSAPRPWSPPYAPLARLLSCRPQNENTPRPGKGGGSEVGGVQLTCRCSSSLRPDRPAAGHPQMRELNECFLRMHQNTWCSVTQQLPTANVSLVSALLSL